MSFTQIILAWYDEHRRDLPWRNVSDPYRIWVSEIILQQTRVEQGYAYYQRFVEAFPSVEHLARANEDEVLRLWQGLGYYSRARNLHAAARQVMQAGGFPTDYAGVRALKGIGDYTAAAICSFAYGLPCAVVDGNVYRVLSRYWGIAEPIDTGAGKKQFAALAQRLLPDERSADYNQALMDFGALQCVPHSPCCDACPLAASCQAYGSGMVSELPVKAHRTKVKARYFVYVRVATPAGVWLRRREAGDIWQGLYEYPLLEFDHHPTFAEVLAHPLIQPIGARGTWTPLAEGVKHVLSHRVLWTDAYELRFDTPLPLPEGYLQVPFAALDSYAKPQLLLRFNWSNLSQ